MNHQSDKDNPEPEEEQEQEEEEEEDEEKKKKKKKQEEEEEEEEEEKTKKKTTTTEEEEKKKAKSQTRNKSSSCRSKCLARSQKMHLHVRLDDCLTDSSPTGFVTIAGRMHSESEESSCHEGTASNHAQFQAEYRLCHDPFSTSLDSNPTLAFFWVNLALCIKTSYQHCFKGEGTNHEFRRNFGRSIIPKQRETAQQGEVVHHNDLPWPSQI